MNPLLPHINSPQDLKQLTVQQLSQLSQEIRAYIIDTLSETGGHLAPSLGVVELTLVLHKLFSSPKDKIVWDVGHQSYAHKIITGRREAFTTIRQQGGISGFPKPSESPYDAFGVGHASTSISAAFGIACARDLAGEKYNVIAVVGDGALTGGLAFEGLNNAGASGKKIIVILNDNTMSISPNVGAMARYLTNLISNPAYNRIKSEIWDFTGRFEKMGPRIRRAARKMEATLKGFVVPGILFERLGFRYLGPIDGHNISDLINVLGEMREFNGPVLLHVLTKKGRGYSPAEQNAPIFHGLGKFDKSTGQAIRASLVPTYTETFSQTIVDLAKTNSKLVGITAAMSLGTGLKKFADQYPERFFDVGIAEGHAVTFAAGMAMQGYRPVIAIYSSFLQRSYDHVIHDVALQRLPVVLAIDRAGLVGDDGPTHHGVFDLAFLRTIPNMVIMVPKDEEELRHMLNTALSYNEGPIAVRYPRGHGEGVVLTEEYNTLPIGKSELVRDGKQIAILAVGPMVYRALAAAELIEGALGLSTCVVNARFVKPVDLSMLKEIAGRFKLIITMEEGIIKGGFGSEVAEFLVDEKHMDVELVRRGLPDAFISQGDRNYLLDEAGLSPDAILKAVESSIAFRSLKRTSALKGLFRLNRKKKSA
jgi:1-deoxy-D-xylulose-5-phosphate synthase